MFTNKKDRDEFLIKAFNSMANCERRARFNVSEQLSLGELILKLEMITNKNKQIYFDDNTIPISLHSWRGDYTELAIKPKFIEEGSKKVTVKGLLKKLKNSIGKKYDGYKGGKYIMGKTTPVWKSAYGVDNYDGIIDIKDGNTVKIITKKIEY